MISREWSVECSPGFDGYRRTGERSDRGEGVVPSLHHRKEGWPSDQENGAEPPLKARTGWFSEPRKENHPVCVGFGGFALILDDAATPPCGDARRGLRVRPLSKDPVRPGVGNHKYHSPGGA